MNISGSVNHANFFPIISGKKNYTDIESCEAIFENIYNKIYSSVKLILNNYISGNIDDELYTKTHLLTISKKIYLLKKRNYKYYNSILELLQDNITSLYRSYLYYLDNKELLEAMKNCKEKADILLNADKLRDYLEKLKNNIILFETESELDIKASIKEEYIIYIERYGFPNDGVFDMVKLSNILIEINK